MKLQHSLLLIGWVGTTASAFAAVKIEGLRPLAIGVFVASFIAVLASVRLRNAKKGREAGDEEA